MTHKASQLPAFLQLTPESNSDPKQFRVGRICPIPVRLPGDSKRASFHATTAKSSVASRPGTIPEASQKSIEPFAAHIGVPCTQGALDHQLVCGHKISTDQPEQCARNCEQAAISRDHAITGAEPFICVSCIVSEVKAKYDAKVDSFQREMEAIASAARKDIDREEIARRLQVIEIGWCELDLKDMRERIVGGRWSQPFYVDPAYEEAACLLAQEQASPATKEDRSSRSTSSIKANSESSVVSVPSSRSSSPAFSPLATASKIKSSRLPKRC